MKKLRATIKGITEIFNSKFMRFNKYRIEAERHEGGVQEFEWLVLDRGDAVGVLCYDPKRDEVVLANEMRPGALVAGDYPYLDNVVAGGIAKGESPIDAAVREVKEEVDLDLKDPVLVHPGAYVSAGGTSERIAIVAGIVDTSKAGGVHGLAEERENIRTVVMKADEFLRRCRSAEINDMKTLLAGWWLAENRDSLRAKYAPKGPAPRQ